MKRRIVYSIIMVLVLGLGLGLFVARPAVVEAQDPSGCLNNLFTLNILKDKASVHNHEYVTYKVCAANGGEGACNMQHVAINLTLPASDGTATGTVVVLEPSPGRDFPSNGAGDKCYNATDFPELHFYVDVDPGVSWITARVDYSGTLMDSPGGDPAGSFKTLSVTLLNPCINVTKTADTDISKVGDNITYNITVCNCGDVGLTKVSVIDDVVGNLTGSFNATLAQGNCESYNFTHTVTASDPDPLVNTVTVKYQDHTAYAVNATATESVDLVHPSIDVTKTVDPTTSKAGDNVTYTITLNNTSPDANLENITVNDSILGPLSDYFADTLAHGATETHTFQYTIKASDPDTLVNTVTVHANPVGLPNDITDQASATVTLVHPAITCSKNATPTSGRIGTVITYTIKVCNTGDIDLSKTSVIDSLLGDISGSFAATLLHGTCESHNFTRTIGLGDYPGPINNTVNFTYTVPGLGNVLECSSSARVEVINPKLCIEKLVDCNDDKEYLHEDNGSYGDTPSWFIRVWNCGDSPLHAVNVTDTNGMSWGLFDLDIGASWNVTYDGDPIYKTTTNNATAVALDVFDGVVGPVYDSATNKIECTGSIKIIKVVVGATPATDWDFTSTIPGHENFTLPAAGGNITFSGLAAGDYTVTETTKPGYTVTPENPKTLTLPACEDIEYTFTNTATCKWCTKSAVLSQVKQNMGFCCAVPDILVDLRLGPAFDAAKLGTGEPATGSIQAAIDYVNSPAWVDPDNDGQIFIGVTGQDCGTGTVTTPVDCAGQVGRGPYGGGVENVVITNTRTDRMNVFGCSVTLTAANPSLPVITIQNSVGKVTVLDIHVTGSNVAGYVVQNNADLVVVKNSRAKDTTIGYWVKTPGGKVEITGSPEISGNTIGILIDGSNVTLRTNSDIINNGIGIKITGDKNTTNGNEVGTNGHPNGTGILVSGKGNSLAGDSVSYNTGDGVVIAGSGTTLATGNKIEDEDAGYNGDDGIVVSGNYNTVLKNKQTKYNGGDGIEVSGNYNLIQENVCEKNSGMGFNITGNHNTLKKNEAKNNTGLEFHIAANNVNGTGNKKNGTAFNFGAAGGDFN